MNINTLVIPMFRHTEKIREGWGIIEVMYTSTFLFIIKCRLTINTDFGINIFFPYLMENIKVRVTIIIKMLCLSI